MGIRGRVREAEVASGEQDGRKWEKDGEWELTQRTQRHGGHREGQSLAREFTD